MTYRGEFIEPVRAFVAELTGVDVEPTRDKDGLLLNLDDPVTRLRMLGAIKDEHTEPADPAEEA